MSISKSQEIKLKTQRLFQTYQATQDLTIRNEIVHNNLGLVRQEVLYWSNQCGENVEDLQQVGCLGLIQAIERFDLSKGFAFSSFAIPYIRGEIQHYLRDRGYSLRIPRRWLELKRQGQKIIRLLQAELRRQPTDQEIAEQLGISLQEWLEVQLAHQNREPIRLDLSTKSTDQNTSLGDLLPDRQYHSFQLAQEDQIRLHNALLTLEERTRQILEFVFLQDLTQKEVARIFGISVVTVSRQIKKGITQMKKLIISEEI
jgi:RNA polymerase sigma-B factor